MISICCVGFASLDVVCDELNDCAWNVGLQPLSDKCTGQVGLGVGSWPSNRATEGLNPKRTRLYFVILLKDVEKIFDWH